MSLEEDMKSDDRNKKPKLLMIHGFGASGIHFYRLIQLLRRHFRITTIDLLGLGGSGRPPYKLRTSRDSNQFYVLSIEAWMRVQEDIQLVRNGKLTDGHKEKMIVLGHSLGGYLSILYAHRFPERVEQLLLLSAVGVPECPRDFSL